MPKNGKDDPEELTGPRRHVRLGAVGVAGVRRLEIAGGVVDVLERPQQLAVCAVELPQQAADAVAKTTIPHA